MPRMNIDKIVEIAQHRIRLMSGESSERAMTPIILVCLTSPCCFTGGVCVKRMCF